MARGVGQEGGPHATSVHRLCNAASQKPPATGVHLRPFYACRISTSLQRPAGCAGVLPSPRPWALRPTALTRNAGQGQSTRRPNADPDTFVNSAFDDGAGVGLG